MRGKLLLVVLVASASGCRSPYYQDQGALAGGLGGAGLGAIIGSTSGHAGAGAAIGAIAGTLAGSAVGAGMDDIEARNRAQIAAQMGRPLPPGGVRIEDVVAMTRSQVHEEVILTQIRNAGVAAPLRSEDLIYLTQQGVSPRVIAAMQAPPMVQPVVYQAAPPPAVIVEEHYCDPWGRPYRYRHYPPPSVGFGVSVRN